MWEDVEARKHVVNKVFPGRFTPPTATVASTGSTWTTETTLSAGEEGDSLGEEEGQVEEQELMMFGNVTYRLKEKSTSRSGDEGEQEERKNAKVVDWAAYAHLQKREIQGQGETSVDSKIPPQQIWGFKYYRVYLQV